MSPKPTVLFVHGSWHTPAHFERVRRVFEETGYETKCPRQPSVGNLPPVSMMDDAKCITDELARLVETEGKMLSWWRILTAALLPPRVFKDASTRLLVRKRGKRAASSALFTLLLSSFLLGQVCVTLLAVRFRHSFPWM